VGRVAEMATGGLLSVVLGAKMAGNWQLINNISEQSTAQAIAPWRVAYVP